MDTLSKDKVAVQQQLLMRFRAIQGDLRTYIRDVEISSTYAAQSSACRDLARWVGKSDHVLQGLQELKL